MNEITLKPTYISPIVSALIEKLTKSLESKSTVISKNQLNEIIRYAMIFFFKKHEGLHKICASYVKLYSSFVNTNNRIFVSHNRYISSFNLRNEKWSKSHIEFGDSVTRMIQYGELSDDPEQIKIGVFVGYQSIHFMEYSELLFDYMLLDYK